MLIHARKRVRPREEAREHDSGEVEKRIEPVQTDEAIDSVRGTQINETRRVESSTNKGSARANLATLGEHKQKRGRKKSGGGKLSSSCRCSPSCASASSPSPSASSRRPLHPFIFFLRFLLAALFLTSLTSSLSLTVRQKRQTSKQPGRQIDRQTSGQTDTNTR